MDRSSQFYSSRLESDERGRIRERGRDRREKCRDSENGRSSRRRSAASLHTQVRCSHCRHVYHKQPCWKRQESPVCLIHQRPQIARVENTDPPRWMSNRLLLNACRHRWALSHDFLRLYISHKHLEENRSFMYFSPSQGHTLAGRSHYLALCVLGQHVHSIYHLY